MIGGDKVFILISIVQPATGRGLTPVTPSGIVTVMEVVLAAGPPFAFEHYAMIFNQENNKDDLSAYIDNKYERSNHLK